MRNRPARGTADEAKPLLKIQPVGFINDTVNVIAERGALFVELGVMREDFRNSVATPGQRINLKAEFFKALQRIPSRVA